MQPFTTDGNDVYLEPAVQLSNSFPCCASTGAVGNRPTAEAAMVGVPVVDGVGICDGVEVTGSQCGDDLVCRLRRGISQ